MSDLTMGSLFDGSGGFPLAGRLCGIKASWASEIESYPIKVTQKNFPNMKHLGDITKINGVEIEPVDVITFGSPCFPAGTLILTDKDLVPIEDIKVGDMVLTHKGRYRKVTAVGDTIRPVIQLKSFSSTLRCTPNHPIYSQSGIDDVRQWTDAKNMLDKQWATPKQFQNIPVVRFDELTDSDLTNSKLSEFPNELFYFIGLWLGSGSTNEHKQIWLRVPCIILEYFTQIIERLNLPTLQQYSTTNEHCAVFTFDNPQFCDWLNHNFGISDRRRHDTHIPSWIYGECEEFKESLLMGLVNSLGELKDGFIQFRNLTKKLACAIKLLATSLDYKTKMLYDRQGECYGLQMWIYNSIDNQDKLHKWDKVEVVSYIESIEKVYNFSVEEDESYIADTIVVHNCQDLSIAGKQAGIHGERSGLFLDAIRIIKEMRKATNNKYPKYAVWENVFSALSSNKGEDFKVVIEEFIKIINPQITIPKPKKWERAGLVVGDNFSIGWRVLDAQYWGVPQRRRRIFLVADFTDGGGLEKYFLSAKACAGILRRAEKRGKKLPEVLKKALELRISSLTTRGGA